MKRLAAYLLTSHPAQHNIRVNIFVLTFVSSSEMIADEAQLLTTVFVLIRQSRQREMTKGWTERYKQAGRQTDKHTFKQLV